MKYKEGNVIQLGEMKRRILFVFPMFYDETGIGKETYYQTIILDSEHSPTPLKESVIDKYYTLLS